MPRKRWQDDSRRTRYLRVMADANWHSTRELVQRVGHTFGYIKFKLTLEGFDIERRRHPSKAHQYQYRVVSPPE